jgi:preprotein translocase subunit SecG
MLYKFLLVLLIIDALVLITAILLQAGKGGGMAASFGGASSSTDAFMGTRQAGNLLTKASWWCGGIFIGLALVLEINASRGRTPTSVLDKSFTPTKTAPTQQAPPSGAPGANAPAVPLQALPPAPEAKADAKKGAVEAPSAGAKPPDSKKAPEPAPKKP